jgi:hypothetical protein
MSKERTLMSCRSRKINSRRFALGFGWLGACQSRSAEPSVRASSHEAEKSSDSHSNDGCLAATTRRTLNASHQNSTERFFQRLLSNSPKKSKLQSTYVMGSKRIEWRRRIRELCPDQYSDQAYPRRVKAVEPRLAQLKCKGTACYRFAGGLAVQPRPRFRNGT